MINWINSWKAGNKKEVYKLVFMIFNFGLEI